MLNGPKSASHSFRIEAANEEVSTRLSSRKRLTNKRNTKVIAPKG